MKRQLTYLLLVLGVMGFTNLMYPFILSANQRKTLTEKLCTVKYGCNKIELKNGVSVLNGNAKVIYGDTVVLADKIFLNNQKGELKALHGVIYTIAGKAINIEGDSLLLKLPVCKD